MGKEDKDGMLLPSAEEIEKLLAEAEAKGREKGYRQALQDCLGREEVEGEPKDIPDWQLRLLVERKVLLQRTIKLRKTIDNKDMKLNAHEWNLLHNQFGSMRNYLQVLTDRCVYYGLIDESRDLGLHY